MTQNDNQKLIELMNRLGFKLHEHGVMFLQGTRGLACMEIAQKILKEVKKAELRGKISALDGLLVYGNDDVARLNQVVFSKSIFQLKEKYQKQLQALEREGR